MLRELHQRRANAPVPDGWLDRKCLDETDEDPAHYKNNEASKLTIEPFQIDTDNAMWKGLVSWTAPVVYYDMPFYFCVVASDAAWNTEKLYHPDPGFSITVEDNIPPDETKIVWIAAEARILDDPGDGSSDITPTTPDR